MLVLLRVLACILGLSPALQLQPARSESVTAAMNTKSWVVVMEKTGVQGLGKAFTLIDPSSQ
jgi:hypothetical protein